ncbi:hypothetical protein C882_0701 [Caenispirillum salinarum AK4]|uniref:Uncharacterized protein n=1 Tax=Caenispirillum salinarum AK4 TaxID=1238182 RepID=K9GUP1_9PROT|nr:hypothetical protein C882_0701 [Caenispirillum salinarum AK4]
MAVGTNDLQRLHGPHLGCLLRPAESRVAVAGRGQDQHKACQPAAGPFLQANQAVAPVLVGHGTPGPALRGLCTLWRGFYPRSADIEL